MYIKVQMLKIIVVCSIEYIINLKIVLYLKIAALSIFNSTPRILVLGSETQIILQCQSQVYTLCYLEGHFQNCKTLNLEATLGIL